MLLLSCQFAQASWFDCLDSLLHPRQIVRAYKEWRIARESNSMLREDYNHVKQSRRQHRIETIKKPMAFGAGHVVIHSAKDCGPSLWDELLLHPMSGEFPSWTFHSYDYEMLKNGFLLPQVVVFGSRRIYFPFAIADVTSDWLYQRLREAIDLSQNEGHDMVWRAETHSTGKWAIAGSDPRLDMIEDLRFD